MELPESAHIARNSLAFAIRDKFPVSPGHTLVVPFRVVPTWFDANAEEQRAVMDLVAEVKAGLDAGVRFADDSIRVPEGYNVGFNAGEVAGQTVMHLHVHVIPRFRGDVPDPRGGVRHVIPGKGNYLAARVAPLSFGGSEDPFFARVEEAFASADEVRIVAAFVQHSGLELLADAVNAALRRGTSVRIVTGDYLDITQASALWRLLAWQSSVQATRGEGDGELPAALSGSFEARVVETRSGPSAGRSFHPKAWIFVAGPRSVAFVGSSNISKSALIHGVEWNLGVEAVHDAATFEKITSSFDDLWRSASLLNSEWVKAYEARARASATPLPLGEVEAEAAPTFPSPRDVQLEALAQLRAARESGRREGLVVLATGLGKTILAIFDYATFAESRAEPTRLLFIAHRQEILTQAADQIRRFADATGRALSVGWCFGDDGDLDADVVFASVAKLARPTTLARLRGQRFGYVVVDEVHHAAADSYRRVLDAVTYDFLLGLTATPERADEQAYLDAFGGREIYRADIGKGIALKHLVSFAYYGVRDDIDYENIPWRNRRFAIEDLARAAQTEARMETLLRAWRDHPGTRTLVFCCSVEHARYVRDRLVLEGLRVHVVYAGKGSDDRAQALRALRSNDIDAICAVDVFNEGVDVREIDRVVLLRPTESRVVFLQQLGRGLRTHEDKERLVVIDFVGNHRVFADRLRALFSLGSERDAAGALRKFVDAGTPPDLPEGCSVELELEAKQVLERFVRPRVTEATLAAYDELRAKLGRRPSAIELLRKGFSPKSLRATYGGWFRFVDAQGDLSEDEAAIVERFGKLLDDVQFGAANKSFKFIALEAFVNLDGFGPEGASVDEIAAESWRILERRPAELAEVSAEQRPDGTLEGASRFRAYWAGNPIKAWAGTKRDRTTEFELRDGRLYARTGVAEEQRDVLGAMLRELVDLCLGAWRMREAHRDEGFRCKVIRNASQEPILKLAQRNEDIGERDVRLPNGEVWSFRFMTEACNVARPHDSPRNRLGDLLRGWFGPSAGAPGRVHVVRFYASPDGLWVEPETAVDLAEVRARGRVVAYPDLRAAAGLASGSTSDARPDEVVLPVDDQAADVFAVRVFGSSMDGGASPMRSGDWAVLRPARGASPAELVDRVVLAETPDESDGFAYQLKRLARTGGGWMLRSDNPDGPQIQAREPMKVIARLVEVIAPDSLAPPTGSIVAESDLPSAFGIDDLQTRTGRYGGHLFVFLHAAGALVSPTEVSSVAVEHRPAETGFVVARRDDGRWKYLGVGRRAVDAAAAPFVIPEVDHATWRTFGGGSRTSSRTLAPDALRFAERIVASALEMSAPRVIRRRDGAEAFVRARAAGGGVVIDGGEGGFGARTVTLTDFAWLVMAARDQLDHGGELDEARVNKVRYLEGTPKESTRWIDTGWALAAYEAVRERVGLLRREDTGPLRVKDGDAEIDATYSRVREGTESWIFFESRGGAHGSDEEQNTEYNRGLEVLLGQLKDEGVVIREILVDSKTLGEATDDEKRVMLAGYTYPFVIDDPARLRAAIAEGQRHVGRREGAKGAGNSTRRLRISLGAAG